jgi:hypothetical protein
MRSHVPALGIQVTQEETVHNKAERLDSALDQEPGEATVSCLPRRGKQKEPGGCLKKPQVAL